MHNFHHDLSVSGFTSRHDLAHILDCEDREFLLCVHSDHTVTQSAHGQHCFAWRRNTHLWRSVGHTNTHTHTHTPLFQTTASSSFSFTLPCKKVFPLNLFTLSYIRISSLKFFFCATELHIEIHSCKVKEKLYMIFTLF